MLLFGLPTTSQVEAVPRWGQRPELAAHPQELLREVQALRDQLCTEDELSSCSTAQKLLHIYKQLRNPSLVLL